MIDPTKRFSSRVENYVRFRPGYPREIIDLLRNDCGLANDSVIADVGSGTGKLAELFLENGIRVLGVEPNKEMREAGALRLRHFPLFSSVDGAAEAMQLPEHSVDFITVGQAFHWFDHQACRAEFLRVLKRGGWVVIVWNDRRSNATPFLAQYEKLLTDFATDYMKANHRRVDNAATLRQFFRAQPRFRSFATSQQFDFDGLKGRLLSSSYAPEAGQPKHDEMLVALKQIFDSHQQNGRVAFEYNTHVYYSVLS